MRHNLGHPTLELTAKIEKIGFIGHILKCVGAHFKERLDQALTHVEDIGQPNILVPLQLYKSFFSRACNSFLFHNYLICIILRSWLQY